MTETITLWRRPARPPRLPDQPILYPVLNAQYAIMIARDWSIPASGIGNVTRFHVDREFAARYPNRQVGGRHSSNCGCRPYARQ